MNAVTFDDPFEAVILAAAELGAEASVSFANRAQMPRAGGLRFWRRAKGFTFFPDDGSLPLVRVDAGLGRGVEGTLDILAHELAHVLAGPEAGHGPAWRQAYEDIFARCNDRPCVIREISP